MPDASLKLPSRLSALIADGRWPLNNRDANLQNVTPVPCPTVWNEPDCPGIFLYPPPFLSAAEFKNERDFWMTYCAPAEIDLELAVPIGDLGLGSDAPIILDYRDDRDAPRVQLLKWSRAPSGRHDNHWITVARNFDEFCDLLGLDTVDWEGKRRKHDARGSREKVR